MTTQPTPDTRDHVDASDDVDNDHDRAWLTALAAIDEARVTPAIERAVIEAARRVKRRQKLARRHEAQRLRDDLRAQTGRVAAAASKGSSTTPPTSTSTSSSTATSPGELPNHAHCYGCKRPFKTLHPWYHTLCVPCGDANFEKRALTIDVTGRRAILTGGRTKIGYLSALLLLRGGATVTITTRYPHDAARRFAAVEDFATFEDRLRIEKVDFRDIRAVHAFLDGELRKGEPLDILINLAAQTIRASAALERVERERDRLFAMQLTAGDGSRDLSERGRDASRDAAADVANAVDALLVATGGAIVRDGDHGEWVDANARNTWDLPLEDVPLSEFFEVQLVNVFAPWAFTARLQPLLRKSSFLDRYIVQVSAIEGQFDGPPKTGKHPHTNMAKAALHMLVRTSAEPLAREGIFMNAVDPGWVSDQSAILRRPQAPTPTFCPPLDGIDGAARILDPIVRGLRGEKIHGQFLKNYASAPW